MKKPTISTFVTKATVFSLFAGLLASCSSFKPIVGASKDSITESKLESMIIPGKIYKLLLKQKENGFVKIEEIFVSITKITSDTVYCDVKYIAASHWSQGTDESVTYFFKNVSQGGLPTNSKWLWADPNRRLIGLGHISINAISEIRERKYSAGKTAALIAGVVLSPIVILAASISGFDLSGISMRF